MGQYQLNGNASIIGNDTFLLTPSVPWQNGSVFYQIKHHLDSNFNVSGSLYFGNNDAGADGIVFVMQDLCLQAGTSGGGIGYENMPGNSIAVEFDTYENAPGFPNDPAYDHMALLQNGDIDHANNLFGPLQIHATKTNIEDGIWYPFEIIYNPNNLLLQIFFDGTLRISYNIDIKNTIFGGSPYVYWGFTSATGGQFADNSVYIGDASIVSIKDDTICSGSTSVLLPPIGKSYLSGLGISNSSSNQSGGTGPPESDLAFDGNINSRWSSQFSDPQWISMDFGSGVNIDSVVLEWEAAYATEYKIQTSNDNITWTDQFHETAGNGNQDIITFPVVTARYIRMYGIQRATTMGYSLWEFEIWGTGQYAWTPNDGTINDTTSNNPIFTPAVTTTYTVEIPDACLGSVFFDYTVYVETNASLVINQPDPVCAPNTIDLTAPAVTLGSGSGTLSYWQNAAATIPLSNPSTVAISGNYYIVLTDNSCSDTAMVTAVINTGNGINQTITVTSNYNGFDISCADASDGAANTLASGGDGNYIYLWSDGQTTSNATGLSDQTYSITVTDGTGCTDVAVLNINSPDPLQTTTIVGSNYNGYDVSCPNACDADALSQASGGVIQSGTYTYSWSNGNNTQIATGLCGGNLYYVSISDNNACLLVDSILINEPPSITLNVDTTIDISCHGQIDGMAIVEASGGFPGYTYTIDYISAFQNPSGTFNSLDTGMHIVTATDMNGCTVSQYISINDISPIVIELDTFNISCYGLNDGYIAAEVIGGRPFGNGYGYILSWFPANNTAVDSIGGLSAGTYTLSAEDASGCVVTASAVIEEPELIEISTDSIQVATCSDSNGLIRIEATGGPSVLDGLSGAYAYSIDGGDNYQLSNTFSNLPSGFYEIVVQDTAYPHCVNVFAIDLGSNSGLTVDIEVQNEQCYGYSDGSAVVFASSSTGGYSYQWFTDLNPLPFSSAQAITGLSGNVISDGNGGLDTSFIYILIVEDEAGCLYTDSIYVRSPDSMLVNAIVLNDISCYNGNDGRVEAVVTGRTMNAISAYIWSDGQTTAIAEGLEIMNADSSYFIEVIDTAGCVARDTAYLTQPASPLAIAVEGSTISCADSMNGIINLTSISGATAPYFYSFSPFGPFGSESLLTQGFAPGVYDLYIQDANGCIDSVNQIIIRDTVEYAVQAFESQTVTLGESVYIYATMNADGIDSSVVFWKQQDPNTGQMNDLEPTLLQANNPFAGFMADSIYNDINYIIYLNNGCSDSALVEIRIDQDQSIFVPNAFSPNGDGVNDVFTVYGSTDVKQVLKLMVFDRWGAMVHHSENFEANSTDLSNAWNGFFQGKALNPAVFVYYAEIQLLNGTVVRRKGDLTLTR